MARSHEDFLAAGTRIFSISVDSPGQNAAMIDKLDLPFPLLSDPDRKEAIEPFGVTDPKDERNISRPAMILLTPDGEEAWRFVSRDFADRLPEDQVLSYAASIGLSPTRQDRPRPGDPDPGPKALSVEFLPGYFRGARFAALAMGLRHGHHDASIKEDSKAYVAEMDRYMEAVRDLLDRSG